MTVEKKIKQYLKSNGFEIFTPKAVLFDMDGVLFDSMPAHARSWHEAMAAFGVAMSEADAYKYEGMRGVETIRTLCREQWKRDISDKEAGDMYAVKSRIFASQPPALKVKGVERLMHTIKDSGLKICVVTGSGQATLLKKLLGDFEGLLNKDLLVTAFDVERGKPAPDPYIAGLKKCGIEPDEAIVVENAPLGVQAAAAAHIFTIAVNTGPLPDSMLIKAGANLVYGSMDELRLDWENINQTITYRKEMGKREDQWNDTCDKIIAFIKENRRRPSKYYDSDIAMHNWIKYNKKRLNKGKLSAIRMDKFQTLLNLMAKYRRFNIYSYEHPENLYTTDD